MIFYSFLHILHYLQLSYGFLVSPDLIIKGVETVEKCRNNHKTQIKGAAP